MNQPNFRQHVREKPKAGHDFTDDDMCAAQALHNIRKRMDAAEGLLALRGEPEIPGSRVQPSSSEEEASSSEEEADPNDDDVVEWDGRSYAYHPPNKGDCVKILFGPDWYAGTIKAVRAGARPPFEIVFPKTQYSKREVWYFALQIKDFPEKWHFKRLP